MNKLDRFRFGSYHKRRILGLFTIVAGVFLVALILLAVLGIFSFRSELVSIRLSTNRSGQYSNGVGINLDYIPTSNRINYSEFQRENSYKSFTIADCVDDYVFLDANSSISESDIINGSEVRILSLDNDGVMSLRYSGLVNTFISSRFGLNVPIEDTEGYWINDSVIDIASSSGTVVAMTESGKLVLDITSDDFVKTFESEEVVSFKGLCSYGNYIYALTDEGQIYLSNDGRNFSLYYVNDEQFDIRTIAGIGNAVAFITEDNRYCLFTGTSIVEVDVPFEIDENTIISSSSDKLVVVNGNGDVYATSNGLIYSAVHDEVGLFDSLSAIIDYKSVGNCFYYLTEEGRLITLNVDSLSESLSVDLSTISPKLFEVTESGSVIVVTNDRRACLVSSDGHISDLTQNAGSVDSVFLGSGDKLIMKSGNNLYFVTVLSAIQVNSVVPQDLVNPGDLCYIRMVSANSFNEDNWNVLTENTSVSFYNTFDSVVTNSSVRILGLGDGVHAISQPLYGNATDNFSYNTFYRISLKVRSDSENLSNVKVWIYGDVFGEEGFVIDEITSNSTEYSYVFALTGSKTLSDEDKLYFNISFEGDGVVFVDDVYLGEDRYSGNDSVPSAFVEKITASDPSAIRLNNLNFSSSNNSDEIFFGLSNNSLECSLDLVKDSNSSPWFVIGSFAEADSIDRFMGYFCGSVSNEYGKLRIDNGTAIPWSRQFDVIYIEIYDSDNVYLTDMQRGAYVSYVKSLFIQSSFYSEIKDRVIFIDGMTYEGGVVQSSADFHAIDGAINLESVNNLKQVFEEINYEVPRMPLMSSDSGELISNFSYEGEYSGTNTGVLTAPLICNQSSFVRMFMINISVSTIPIDTEGDEIFESNLERDALIAISHLDYINESNALFFDIIDPLDVTSTQSAEQFSNDCVVSLVEKEGVVYLTVVNISETQQQFTVDGVTYGNSHLMRYSSTGELLTDRAYRRSDVRITLQPGETVVISIDNTKK